MKEAFKRKNFHEQSLITISKAIEIINEYAAQGFILTLRQLYYQFVARDEFPDDRRWQWTGQKWIRDENGTKNAQPNYKWLGGLINDARLCGYIDWNTIEDRTREVKSQWHFDGPKDAIEQMRNQYVIDMWDNQDTRCEVWIEKEALVGVIARVCSDLDVPYFACRGFVSQSEMYDAGKRAERRFLDEGQHTVIIHLGDHDPSGMDMTRDNDERMYMFSGDAVPEIKRIALNQVETYDPPPSPAKLTDSRAKKYIEEFGHDSWELDALEPKFIAKLIRTTVDEHRDMDLWEKKEAQVEGERERLDEIIEDLS